MPSILNLQILAKIMLLILLTQYSLNELHLSKQIIHLVPITVTLLKTVTRSLAWHNKFHGRTPRITSLISRVSSYGCSPQTTLLSLLKSLAPIRPPFIPQIPNEHLLSARQTACWVLGISKVGNSQKYL